MNAVNGCGLSLPATNVLRLSPERPVRQVRPAADTETLLAAVRFPPRASETRRLGDLLPDVLASYGIATQPLAASRDVLFEEAPFEEVAFEAVA